MNTLRELAEAIQNNSISESVLQQIGSKVSAEDFEEFKQTLNDLYAPKIIIMTSGMFVISSFY